MKELDERTAGDISLQRDLLKCLEKNLAESRNLLSSYALDDNRIAMSDELHKMKGSVGIFGFVNVSERIAQIGDVLKSDSKADFPALISELFSAIDKHIVELKKYIY